MFWACCMGSILAADMTDSTFSFRPASLTDLDVLLPLAEHTFRAAFEHLNDPADFNAYCREAFRRPRFEQEMSHPESAFWLAYWEGQVAAYLKLNFDRNPPELAGEKTVNVERLYVHPQMQGRRVGERLLEFSYQVAQQRGADWVWLTVWQENPAAVRFYERHDYEKCGTKVFQLGDDAQTDWLMRKRVTAPQTQQS